jgi:hypothetical protein
MRPGVTANLLAAVWVVSPLASAWVMRRCRDLLVTQVETA